MIKNVGQGGSSNGSSLFLSPIYFMAENIRWHTIIACIHLLTLSIGNANNKAPTATCDISATILMPATFLTTKDARYKSSKITLFRTPGSCLSKTFSKKMVISITNSISNIILLSFPNSSILDFIQHHLPLIHIIPVGFKSLHIKIRN